MQLIKSIPVENGSYCFRLPADFCPNYKKIGFKDGWNPNNRDLPKYVVVEFNSLKLPTEVQEDCEEKVNTKTDVIAWNIYSQKYFLFITKNFR